MAGNAVRGTGPAGPDGDTGAGIPTPIAAASIPISGSAGAFSHCIGKQSIRQDMASTIAGRVAKPMRVSGPGIARTAGRKNRLENIPKPQGEVHRLFPLIVGAPHGQGGVQLARNKGQTGVYAILKTRAKYHLGQVVRHKKHPFRGVIFDVDAMFSNTDEWYDAIPEDSRPSKDQPFYHLLAENDQSYYVAYVSEQNLVADYSGEPVDHPDLPDLFGDFEDGHYPLHFQMN